MLRQSIGNGCIRDTLVESSSWQYTTLYHVGKNNLLLKLNCYATETISGVNPLRQETT